jgi:hypothetical protein
MWYQCTTMDPFSHLCQNRTLLKAVATHGTSWKEIQECHFPGRAANNVKNQ